MKAFEDYWNKIGQYEFSTYLTKDQSKLVWEAALEWVLSLTENDCTAGDEYNPAEYISDSSIGLIEKELEE